MATIIPTRATNLAELYKEAAEKYAERPAFATRNGSGEFESKSFKELYEEGLYLATALIDMGIEAREHVGLLADNRYEWILSDYGILLTGAADVPRGTDVTDGDVKYIITHSDAKVVFVEHQKMLDKLKDNLSELPNVKQIVMMDKDTKVDDANVVNVYDLIEKGKKLRESGDKRVEERVAQIKPE